MDDDEIAKLQQERLKAEGKIVGLGTAVGYDQDLYGTGDKYAGYSGSIAVADEEEDEEEDDGSRRPQRSSYTAPKSVYRDIPGAEEEEDPFQGHREKTIKEREDEYHKRKFDRINTASVEDGRSYREVMAEQQLEREEADLRQKLQKKLEEERELKAKNDRDEAAASTAGSSKKKRRWDVTEAVPSAATDTPDAKKAKKSEWDEPDEAPVKRKSSRWDQTPADATSSGSRWDQTPQQTDKSALASETPGRRTRSRWDETPQISAGGMTPSSVFGATPMGNMGMETPNASAFNAGVVPMTPDQMWAQRAEADIMERNKPLSDADLDAMLPSDGYEILTPPQSYQPIRTPARKLMATPTPFAGGFMIPGTPDGRTRAEDFGVPVEVSPDLPSIKPEDRPYFEKLLDGKDDASLSTEEIKERKIMRLLLKVKNGTPAQRKQALRHLTDKARDFGPGPLFNQILPLLMSPALEDQERHLLVKVIDRVLYKLDDLVRPYVHKILVVIEPLLIDEDYYARVEGREIISNLAKAAGLATMIAVMRPDIDNVDEYVRNTTARAFSVVASALGIPALLPFLKAVCQSKKSWQARHTGIKIVQQIAILLGCGILPHLKSLVDIIEHGLKDEQQKVRTITALALSALAEAAAPYGIESFDSVLKPLWYGIRQHRGKALAAFLKAIGCIIPLMDAEYASYYTKEVMTVLIREFNTPDEEMKKIVLKVVKQCVATDGVEPSYIRAEILDPFFKAFWIRRMSLDRRNYKALVETTVELANKVGAADCISRIVDDLKDESEPYRKMVAECVDKVISNLGCSDIDEGLEKRLMDGILYGYQEQTTEETNVILNAFGTVINSLNMRSKVYLPQIAQIIKWRLNNRAPKVRQQSADLISRIAGVMKNCNEEKVMGHLGLVLYEYLGEEFPEVLGSILGALKAIVNVIGMTKMNPPIKDLLPRLTPILKNRHEKVQENCIDLVGRIADRGHEYVSAREWMRICFELLEMLKAHKKGIRRAAVNTFGYIAKAIGPQDVLATLLNNLRVQERQNRVCTTVAIAIVAETCAPFTVLPALMNEYRVPELNVQNGVLKALSFLFEYIGEMGKDYIYAVTPLLEDALMDRDAVHRQTAASVVKHVTLGVQGLGTEDAVLHLLNYVWPNIFEQSPHVINAVTEAIDGCRMALGPAVILSYLLQGLFHPARKVRMAYWKVYNNAYIGHQDAMVACYPRIPNDERNTFVRSELDLIV